MPLLPFNSVGGYSTGITATAVIDVLGNITGVGATFSGLIRANAGISAAGGVTFAGTLRGTTANFTGLVSSTVGFSGSGTNLTNIVKTINGLSGAVGITNGSGIGLSVSGNTLTVSNTGVLSFNDLTGAVTGVTTGNANTFGPLQSFTNGISTSGITIGNGGYLKLIGSCAAQSSIISQESGYLDIQSNTPITLTCTLSSSYLFINSADILLQSIVGPVYIGDGDGASNGTYIAVNDTTQIIDHNATDHNFNGTVNLATSSLKINGSQGSNNQVLTSTGTGITWASVSSSGISRSIFTITGSTTAGSNASTDYVYNGNTSGNITLTMPTAASNTNRYTIKNSNTGILTVSTTSSQTIDGVTFYNLNKQYQAIDLLSDNSNWFII
jgi:hypothetical protein